MEDSCLHFLMNALGVTGRELAAAVHVDPSLVSKWKHSQRPLSPDSVHVPRIAEYFLSLEQPLTQRILQEMLINYQPDLDYADGKARLTCLCRYLTETAPFHLRLGQHDGSKNHYDALYTVYRGNEGRRQAVLAFLDRVLGMPPGQKLCLLSQEDMSWLVEDPFFLEEWKEKLALVLADRHKIEIIHWVDRSVDSLSEIIGRWLPLHLTGGIQSWFLPRYADDPFQTTYFIVEDALVVVGMAGDNPSCERYTAMFGDPITVKQYQGIFAAYKAKCRPLIEVDDLAYHRFAAQAASRAYLSWDLPPMAAMSQDLLRKILAKSNIGEDRVSHCLKCHELMLNTPSRHLCNRDGLRQALEQNQVNYRELSLLAGQPIKAAREDVREHVDELIQRLRTDASLEVALFSAKDLTHPPINLWLQDELIVAWSKDYPFAASVSEATVVSAFFKYYEDIWQSIPRINRERNWVIQELLKLG